jgi:GNAT superfamily N-acetyltransferase
VREGRVVGTLQLTVIPGLSRKGSTRSLIEGVRIHSDERGSGLGTRFIEWAIEESRRQGCQLVELTSDATRTDAHRFYERLGFTASHVGFKLAL